MDGADSISHLYYRRIEEQVAEVTPLMSTAVSFQRPENTSDAPDGNDDLHALTRLLALFTPHDGSVDIAANALHIIKSSRPCEAQTYTLSRPSICLVPQGAKRVTLARESFEYDHSKMVVYAAEVPIHVTITQASPEQPYYCLVIPIDPATLNRLVLKVFPNGLPKSERTRAVYVGDASTHIVSTARRMMEIVVNQQDTDLLVPHTVDEILLRLLRSPVGPAIAQLGVTDSHIDKVSTAISWIKANFTDTLKVNELAKRSGMSPSSFHSHFKEVTQLSPLQFQKVLRLQEARALLRRGVMDVTHVAYEVGYTSTSQFSREYTREFGRAPSKDACSHV